MLESESDLVRRIVADMKDRPGPLIEVLHSVQAALGYVPADAVPILAEALNLSRAEVHGVVTYYHHFRSAPAGRIEGTIVYQGPPPSVDAMGVPLGRVVLLFAVGSFLVTVFEGFFQTRKIQPNGFRWRTLRNELLFAALNLVATAFLLGSLSSYLSRHGYIAFNTARASPWITSSTSRTVSGSSADVTSSSSKTFGRIASDRAIATRCC